VVLLPIVAASYLNEYFLTEFAVKAPKLPVQLAKLLRAEALPAAEPASNFFPK